MQTRQLSDIYEHGDVYETIDTCNELEVQLSRLKRQRVLDEEEWLESKREVATIRERLEDIIGDAALKPRGPRLP